MAIQRLTAAYRSRSRPSSTPGAKASTMCPSYLDGDQALLGPVKVLEAPGDTRWLAAIVATAASWHGCAVFKVRKEARAPDWGARSLKTQQHAPRRSAYGAVGRVRIGGPLGIEA
jgi:hypothetical protein